MITRKTKDIPTTTHTFLVTVELIDENDVERIALRLADSLAWVEDVGYVDVKYEGSLDKTRPSKTVWR